MAPTQPSDAHNADLQTEAAQTANSAADRDVVAMVASVRAATRIVLGNWKMNGVTGDIDALEAMAQSKAVRAGGEATVTGIAPPATLLSWLNHRLTEDRTDMFVVGAQDCAIARQPGAHTGDLSADMLRDAGAQFVIVGHSERRGDHGETDAVVARKAHAVVEAGLVAVVCVGETAGQRARGLTAAVLERQVRASVPAAVAPDQLIVAYEPVWAIGTGLVPSIDDIAAAHAGLRAALADHLTDPAAPQTVTPLLYGGSVKASNAGEILAIEGVDGALVGGASLKAASFLPIVEAAQG